MVTMLWLLSIVNSNSPFREWPNYRTPCFYGLTEWTCCFAVITKGHSKLTYRANKEILVLNIFQKVRASGFIAAKIVTVFCWLMVKLSSFNYRFINHRVTQQGLGLIAAKMADANVLIIQHFAAILPNNLPNKDPTFLNTI